MFPLHILAVTALANVLRPHHFTEMEVEGQINNLKEQTMKRENAIYDKIGLNKKYHETASDGVEESEEDSDEKSEEDGEKKSKKNKKTVGFAPVVTGEFYQIDDGNRLNPK